MARRAARASEPSGRDAVHGRLWPWLLVGLGALAYRRVFETYFSQDDFRWLWGAAGGASAGPLTPRYASTILYFRVLSAAFGFTPWLFHAFNLGLHLATGVLLYRLLASRLSASWAAAVAALFLSSPAVFDALHWVSAVTDLLCGFFLALTLWLLASSPAPGAWRPWVALGSYAMALSSKEVAVGAAPLLALLAWRRGGPASRLSAVGLVALAVLGGALTLSVVRAVGTGEAYTVRPAAVLLNLPGYVSAAAAGGLAARAASDLPWSRAPLALVAGWLGLLIWIGWLVRRRSAVAWFGLGWFLAVLLPVLLLQHQFYFYYLYCALPGLLASIAASLHPPRRLPSSVVPVLAAVLALAQGVAVEVRAGSRLQSGALPSDFVLRRALTARNALADLQAQAAALKPRLVIVGRQPVATSSGGMTTTPETRYVRDPFWEANVRAALAEGLAVRLRHPAVQEVRFVRWLEPEDSASAIAPCEIDGHLRVMDFATYAAGTSGSGTRLEDRLARAAVLIEKHLFSEARRELEAANRLNPDQPDVLVNLGTVYVMLRDTTAAIHALARAVEVAPHDVEALFNLGLVHWRTASPDAARRVWARLEAEAPRSDLARLARDLMSGKAR